jgi:hypothetical protein
LKETLGLLSAIPGQFVGAAVFFGNLGAHKGDITLTLVNTAVCMLIGNLAGILSAKLPEWFKPKEDERFGLLEQTASGIEDPGSASDTDHSSLQLLRQRVYQVATGYEDCNDADYLRVDPALRLALGKEHDGGACQSGLCRFENDILVTENRGKAPEAGLSRFADTLL